MELLRKCGCSGCHHTLRISIGYAGATPVDCVSPACWTSLSSGFLIALLAAGTITVKMLTVCGMLRWQGVRIRTLAWAKPDSNLPSAPSGACKLLFICVFIRLNMKIWMGLRSLLQNFLIISCKKNFQTLTILFLENSKEKIKLSIL